MRRFGDVRRVVVKVGTNVLATEDRIDQSYIEELAGQIRRAQEGARDVCIVSSGAIGLGSKELGISGRVQDIVLRQACAAVGQPILMNTYKRAFAAKGLQIAQVLITREVFNNRTSYVNLRNSVERLFDLGVIPVFNENDSVATAEIGTAFGDNDQLSALVASKVDAGLLILLSDIDGYYDLDPRKHREARKLDTVESVTEEMVQSAGRAGSVLGTGGMATKLKAVRIAADAGCRVVLAHGREEDVVPRILGGESIGTVFASKRKLRNRTRWLLHSEPKGALTVDDGALEAIRNHKSLLARGIVAVDGTFDAGEVVSVNRVAKLVSNFSSSELQELIGKHSQEIAAVVGDARKLVARPEQMVFLDE